MTNTSTHPDKCIGNVTTETQMSDTPRTDAILMECPSHLQEVALANLALDLERELAHSLAKLKTDLRRSIKIADVLRSGGSRSCRELHHSKRDQHEYGEVCPVEERLKKAESELTKLKATLNKKK